MSDGPVDRRPAEDLWYYIGAFRRYWWLLAGAAVVSAGAVLLLDRTRLPEYQAEALLQQRSDAPVTSVGFGAALSGTDFGSHLDILRSTAVMTPVVQDLGLQLSLLDRVNLRSRVLLGAQVDPNPPRGEYEVQRRGPDLVLSPAGESRVVASAAPGEPLEGPGFTVSMADTDLLAEPLPFRVGDIDTSVDQLVRRVQVEQGNGVDLIWIRYVSPDPQLAANIANGIAVAYQEHRADTERQAARRRRDAIASQISEVADSLQSAQQSVLTYQETERLQDPAIEGNALLSEVLRTDSEVRDLKLQETLLTSVVTNLETGGEVRSALEQVVSLGGETVAPRAGTLLQQLETLELERSGLTAGTFGRTASDPAVEALDQQILATREEMQRLVEQSLDIVRSRSQSAQGRYASLSAQAGAIPRRSAEFGRLQQRVDAVQSVFDELVNSYYQAKIAEKVEAGDIDIIAPAVVPVRPLPSRTRLRLLVAVVAGMLVGSIGVLALEQLDSRIRDPKEARRVAQVDVIGVVPAVRSVSDESPTAILGKEVFRSIRTHLRFAPVENLQVLVVTSAAPREGKTTIAANLALTMAEQGVNTVLVDSDIRRPQVHRTFGVESSPGLSDVLQGTVDLSDAVQAVPTNPSLHVLAAGSSTLAPTELIGGGGFDELVNDLRRGYEFVVLDTPPILAVTDALLGSVLADGVVIVARANKTDATALDNAVQQLRRVGATVLGIVLNEVNARRPGYGYAYHYYPSESREQSVADAKEKRFVLRAAKSANE
jgi:capsular exopolysaccharide synthesis family protein